MIEFRMPALGADMDEGTLLEWKVKPGEAVAKGQVIAVVDTAKTAIDVECWQDGVVHRLIAEPGQKLPVGAVMALLLAPGEAPPTEPPASTAERLSGAKAGGSDVLRRISPAARKRAEELGVALERLVGTGPQGAVTREDVERTARGEGLFSSSDRAASMREAIAAAMSRAKREIPHYYLSEEIPLGKSLSWLAERNSAQPLAERILPAVLLIKAAALALKRYPEFNGHYRDGRFTAAPCVNPGIAVVLKEGLLAPALFAAEGKPVAILQHELADLVGRARRGSLTDAELREATITLTNLGDQGPHGVFPVIVPPQVAIIGFGRIHERPWVVEGRMTVEPMVIASLAADHRVSDGHRGGLLLRELAEILQHPEELA